jgi:hypothetical protein
MHTMKAYREMEVYLHPFLTSALTEDGGQLHAAPATLAPVPTK